MEKKLKLKLIVSLFLLVALIGGISYKVYTNSGEADTTENNKAMAVYIGDEDGNYSLSSTSSFPTDGYVLNTEKSKCTNGGVLSQDATTKKISVTVTSSDKCNLYFDKEVPASEKTLNYLGLTVKSGTPDFTKIEPVTKSYSDGNFSGNVSTRDMSSRASRYITYASSYTFDTSTGTYTLVNPSVGMYSSVYSTLGGKYIVSRTGSKSNSAETYTSLSTIYKVSSSTTSSTLYTTVSNVLVSSYDSSGSGIYAAEDDYGTSYYFRGAVENNYVYFAGFYWRIIRINGDGSLRIIYDGTQAYSNGTVNTSRYVGTSVFNSTYNSSAYIGYMYGTAGASTYAETHANTNSSMIKQYLDSWYKTNIEDAGYSDAVSDTLFCGDRSLYSGTGLGTTSSRYGGYDRVFNNVAPVLTCSQKNDAYTVGDTTNGNGALTYPVGLVSADEVAMAGAIYCNSNETVNSNYYLYKGNGYWTMSPWNSSSSVSIIIVDREGPVIAAVLSDYTYGVAPVINLTPEYVMTMTGTGTMTDPFVAE